jgi:hypothetical protein
MECNFCKFNPICNEPGDEVFVDSLFERTVPKRLRGSEVLPDVAAPEGPVVGAAA